MTSSPLFCAAMITSAHGIQGHVKVKCFLETPQDFKNYAPFCNEQGEPLYEVAKVFSQTQDLLVVSLKGVTDRTQAEALKGTPLMLSRDKLKPLTEDTFYHQDLIGLQVRSEEGKALGTVHALYNFGAGDILELQVEKRLVMILFTHEMVPTLNLPEGYLQLSASGERSVVDA